MLPTRFQYVVARIHTRDNTCPISRSFYCYLTKLIKASTVGVDDGWFQCGELWRSPLEMLISELAKRDVVTALKAKRARAAAGLGTSAARARWEEIQLSDVKPVIEFTRELMAAHLE